MIHGRRQAAAVYGGFLVLVPLAAHLLFSRLGFNPTDDGFTLAYARRLLEGEIPHRDFLIIRPFLSPLLHVPEVAWGGGATYLLSRLVVWFQFAVIGLGMATFVARANGGPSRPTMHVGVALIGTIFTAHSFPLMAWHSIDGLMLGVVGLVLAGGGAGRRKILGYLLLGAAPLCKQSFVFLPLGALLILGDRRNLLCWVAAAAPALAMVCYLALHAALADAAAQLLAHGDLWRFGLLPYLNPTTGAAAVVGAAIARGLAAGSRALQASACAAFALLFAGAALGMATGNMHDVGFGLFGLTAGWSLAQLPGGGGAALALLLVWSVSISVGYNSPALGSGVCMAWLLVAGRPLRVLRTTGVRAGFLGGLVLLAVVGFWFARTTHVYRDGRLPELTRRLDGLLPGGDGIVTSPRTFDFLADLDRAVAEAGRRGKRFAILPDCAGYWACAAQRNPLPIDWALDVELNRPQAAERVVSTLEAERGRLVVIVQRIKASKLDTGWVRYPAAGAYAPDRHVVANWRRVESFEYFDLYE